jgi:hypothetical protein
MASKVQELEARVAALERELSSLRAELNGGNQVPWYRRVAGAFAGDAVYEEITRLGQKIRRAERRKAR